MKPTVLTVTLAIPLRKGMGLAPGVGMPPRSESLWIHDSTIAMLNSSEEG
jgi:hypothetical protein